MSNAQPSIIQGRYYIERVLGNGGFGRVYLAYDAHDQRRCAIKEIPIEGPIDHDFVMHEAMALSSYAHLPFVPTIYDAFFDRHGFHQTGYVVMEYIEGVSSAHVQPWTADHTARFLNTMLAQLAQLHGRGFVHRDIKPDNILVRPDGTYALVDFGISKSGTHTRAIVRSAHTPQFAAPEQLAGMPTDNRSDLYSLGATAYFLLTRTHIGAVNTHQRAQQLANLRQAYPALRPAVAHTLAALLALDPDDRPRTAEDACAMLKLESQRRRNVPLIAAAALLVAALGGGGAYAVANLANNNPTPIVNEGERGVDVPLSTAASATSTIVASTAPTASATSAVVAGAVPTATAAPSPTATPSAAPSPTPVSPTATPSTPFPEGAVQAALRPAGGTWGVVVFDATKNEQVYNTNADATFTAASLAKLPIALAVYRLAEQGALNLDQELELTAADAATGGTGKLKDAELGTPYSIRDLCRRMLTDSDNVAGNMLLSKIGFDAVNTTSAELGARNTEQRRRFLDTEAQAQGIENTTTPADIAQLLEALNRGSVLTEVHRNEILDALSSAPRDKLASSLPKGTDIAHKTGVLPGVEHDAGIVMLDQVQYVIVVMGEGLPNGEAGQEAIAQVSQTVYTWFTGQ